MKTPGEKGETVASAWDREQKKAKHRIAHPETFELQACSTRAAMHRSFRNIGTSVVQISSPQARLQWQVFHRRNEQRSLDGSAGNSSHCGEIWHPNDGVG